MNTIHISDQCTEQEWEHFLLSLDRPPFLQSWSMRSLHAELHEETIPVVMRKSGAVIGVALCIVQRARRGHYLYLPYGPVLSQEGWTHFKELTNYLKQRALEAGVDFIRSSPFILHNTQHQQLYRSNGWRPAPIHMLAEHIWWLDITPDEKSLFSGMRKTMRNSIRKAEKEGVTVRVSDSLSDVDLFYNIHSETASRHQFVPYSRAYVKAQFAAFVQKDHVRMFVSEYQGKPIAAAMIVFYGNMASYHHGASLSAYAKLPSSYLLQWTAIQEAKKRKCDVYNFWGIVPEEHRYSPFLKKPHPFLGVTTFKTGFGGTLFNVLHAQDYPITKKYLLTRPFEVLRRLRRGFWY